MDEQQQKAYEDMIREANLQATQQKTQNYQQEVMLQQEDKSMIAEQLDLSDEKLELYKQLKGFVARPNEDGDGLVWTTDDDNDLSFLTEAGINFCFWTLTGYLNKNILLGNYDDKTIREKMEDIGNTINDTLFTKSNVYFKEPTLEDCKKELERRIKKKVDIRKFALEIIGKKVDEKEIKQQLMKEIEGTIERELDKLKVQIMNDRLKMLDALVQWMCNQIHGAYQRAWKGQERSTLRTHMHISENKGGSPPAQGGSSMNPFNWAKRR